eukprot:11180739-Lingulodinium_polyedra.AAC.1
MAASLQTEAQRRHMCQRPADDPIVLACRRRFHPRRRPIVHRRRAIACCAVNLTIRSPAAR